MSAEDIDVEKAVREPLTGKDTDGPAKVQFVTSTTGDGKNGEVNIVTATKPRRSGLSKEELMKYANDPFWVRLRMIFFILFWIIWFGMLIGAIVIIIVVPKCPPSSKLKWYQKTSIYEVDVKSLADGVLGNFGYIGKLAMESIVLNSFYGNSFTELKSEVGSDSEFKSFVDKAGNKGKKVILAFDFRYTIKNHTWLQKQFSGNSGFADYYLYTDNETVFSKNDQWTKHEESGKYYFAPLIDGKIDRDFATLNFENKEVVEEVKNVIQFWKKERKVNGFELLNADDLLPDSLFPNNTKRNVEIISKLRTHLYTKVDVSGKTGFFVDVSNRNEIAEFVGEPDSKIADLIVTDFFTAINANSKAKDVKKVMNDHYESLPKWPSAAGSRYGPWLGCRMSKRGKAIEETVGVDMVNSAYMMFYLMPNCTVMLTAGDELSEEEKKTSGNSTYYDHYNSTKVELVRKLGRIRRQHIDSILMGSIKFPLEDDDVLTLVRFYPGLDGFLLIVNFANEDKTVKLDTNDYLPDKGSLILTSKEIEPEKQDINLKEDISIGAKESKLVQFTPLITE
ncbi:maltase 1-like protein [Leptotrombidium deliense]|uniref:Maltase 1-like protein n=1 Tax=Leptotrombidium deliense TaxID=299467 RepID=A0A443SUK8_9ACAR|nr:maltase 1-like protein [Leptotrombidium deliense]